MRAPPQKEMPRFAGAVGLRAPALAPAPRNQDKFANRCWRRWEAAGERRYQPGEALPGVPAAAPGARLCLRAAPERPPGGLRSPSGRGAPH